MDTASRPTACPECGGVLHAIEVIGAERPQLRYRESDAKQGFLGKWSGDTGILQFQMCTDCRRVFIYAVPKA